MIPYDTYNTTSTKLRDFECEACAIAEPEQQDDPVSHPHHYTAGNIECIDYIDSCGYGLDFCLGNAIKYLTRCKLNGTTVQDIRKAIWYATHAAEKLEAGVYDIAGSDGI